MLQTTSSQKNSKTELDYNSSNIKLINTAFMSVLKFSFISMITITAISSILQTPVLAIAQTISDDPVIIAQQYLDKSTIKHSFKIPKTLQEAKDFLSTKKYENGSSLGMIKVNVGNKTLDIPISLDLTIDETKVNEQVSQSQKAMLQDFLRAKTNLTDANLQSQENTFGLDYNPVEASSNFTVDELNAGINENSTGSVKISSVIYTVEKTTPEAKQLQKDNKSTTKKSKVVKNKSEIISQDLIELIEPTEDTKVKVLAQAVETKQGIERKKKEISIGKENQKIKDINIKKTKILQKQKAKEIKKLIKDGKKSQIKVEDVYALGEESRLLGLEIIIPKLPPVIASQKIVIDESQAKASVKIDESKALNYKEEVSFLEGLLKIGSISADAFSPEQNNVSINHAKPTTHYGTSLDLYGGNTNNGADIDVWKSSGSWNQKFYLYSDDTIRIAGKCVDLSGSNISYGTRIQLWDCNNSGAQKWVYDTEGLIRLKANTAWCLDTYTGNQGYKIFLAQCGSTGYTEGWRAGDYEMRIYSRRGSSNILKDIGHAFVGVAKYNKYNWINEYSTYSLWPDPKDTDDSNNYYKNFQAQWNQIEVGDKKSSDWWDSIQVNKTNDMDDGYNATQFANYTNPLIAYWQKNITSAEYSNIINYKYFNGQSNYLLQGNVCTNYSVDFWNNYNGKYIGTFREVAFPIDLYNKLVTTQVY